MEENQIIDVSKIKIIPSDTEIPVHNHNIQTKRALCTNFPDNTTILDRTETCINNIPQHIEELLAIFNPLSVEECSSDLFKDRKYTIIKTLDELKKYLSELLIRFDTGPRNYTKEDYLYLLSILYKSLIYLYLSNPESVITTEWLNPHSDEKVPSEKLVKETIDGIESTITESVVELDLKVDLEIENRLSEISRIDESISDINDLIPSEATSSNQLADKEFVHDLIATNASNFRGDWANWTSVPTDSLYYPEDYTGNKKPNNNDYLIIQNATDYSSEYTGIWRFVYKGDWDTLGKSGWQPQYRVELAFTLELLAAINSGITSTKVTTYDGYLPLILACM